MFLIGSDTLEWGLFVFIFIIYFVLDLRHAFGWYWEKNTSQIQILAAF